MSKPALLLIELSNFSAENAEDAEWGRAFIYQIPGLQPDSYGSGSA